MNSFSFHSLYCVFFKKLDSAPFLGSGCITSTFQSMLQRAGRESAASRYRVPVRTQEKGPKGPQEFFESEVFHR